MTTISKPGASLIPISTFHLLVAGVEFTKSKTVWFLLLTHSLRKKIEVEQCLLGTRFNSLNPFLKRKEKFRDIQCARRSWRDLGGEIPLLGRCSEPPSHGPKSVTMRLSVDRWNRRRGIELRNQSEERRLCWVRGKAIQGNALSQALFWFLGVIDPLHARKDRVGTWESQRAGHGRPPTMKAKCG